MTVLVSGMSEISAASLAAIVRNADTTTLIVDCRCLAEFKQSHICRATNPFYSKLLQRRLLENKEVMMHLAWNCINPKRRGVETSLDTSLLTTACDRQRVSGCAQHVRCGLGGGAWLHYTGPIVCVIAKRLSPSSSFVEVSY
ncbi:unnamed protein product [Nippostrongylus brasiliensis]|uniref:Rhodanese domain-containing protein n=1 Tax=Nippostrongylus brasiliensis TaxID=27835 RepID=A0A0N4Y820_NIPBR|nr:unnamed protein product [Nippostrongylus brasiliensis]